VEPHYQLPFVHWFPKAPVRKTAIKFQLKLGLASKFFPQYSTQQRVDIIYKYAVKETFYRSVQELASAFNAQGIEPSFKAGMSAFIQVKLGGAYTIAAPAIAAFRSVMFTGTKVMQSRQRGL
jgi:hypothetical protein